MCLPRTRFHESASRSHGATRTQLAPSPPGKVSRASRGSRRAAGRAALCRPRCALAQPANLRSDRRPRRARVGSSWRTRSVPLTAALGSFVSSILRPPAARTPARCARCPRWQSQGLGTGTGANQRCPTPVAASMGRGDLAKSKTAFYKLLLRYSIPSPLLFPALPLPIYY